MSTYDGRPTPSVRFVPMPEPSCYECGSENVEVDIDWENREAISCLNRECPLSEYWT